MGKAIWLFLNLLFSEHRDGTISKIKYETIHRNTGIPRSTIIKHMHRLKRRGYITMRTVEGRFLAIEITKWKKQEDKEKENNKLVRRELVWKELNRNNRVIKKGNSAEPEMETLGEDEF